MAVGDGVLLDGAESGCRSSGGVLLVLGVDLPPLVLT